MEFYTDDKRDYTPIIENWVYKFVSSMEEWSDLERGDDSGDSPFGVKIIFDGYADYEGEDENGEYVYEEGGNKDMMSFAVFVHKNSLTEEFPEHELTPWGLIHRPKEECCIYAWYDVNEDRIDVIPFEDNNSTELDHKEVNNLIFEIDNKYNT